MHNEGCGVMKGKNRYLQIRQNIIWQLVQNRISQNMTQEELAKKIGTQRSNICRLESGNHSPSLDLLIKISDALGKDLSLNLNEKKAEIIPNKYVVRLYDDDLISFTLEEKGLEGLIVKIQNLDSGVKSRAESW
jgi:transcriptional regulator with XRE-family HTH domain